MADMIHNARVQLIATLLNNAALAFIVAGFIAPAASGQLQRGWPLLATIAWVATGLVLHRAAYFALGRLRQ